MYGAVAGSLDRGTGDGLRGERRFGYQLPGVDCTPETGSKKKPTRANAFRRWLRKYRLKKREGANSEEGQEGFEGRATGIILVGRLDVASDDVGI